MIDDMVIGEHWENGGVANYQLDPDGLPDFGAGPLLMAPGESLEVTILFSPTELSDDGAVLTIRSNDSAKDPLEIELRGLGSNNQCPTADARARVSTTGTAWLSELHTTPLTTLQLTARQSTDLNGTVSTYLWEVAMRPDGSTTTITPHNQISDPTFSPNPSPASGRGEPEFWVGGPIARV